MAQLLLGGRRRGSGNPKGVPRWIGGSELPPHGQGTGPSAPRPGGSAVPISEETLGRAEALIGRYPERRSALLPLLYLVQAADGYVSPAGIEQVARLLGLTKAEVAGVATFY